jgi:hypothetical protein
LKANFLALALVQAPSSILGASHMIEKEKNSYWPCLKSFALETFFIAKKFFSAFFKFQVWKFELRAWLRAKTNPIDLLGAIGMAKGIFLLSKLLSNFEPHSSKFKSKVKSKNLFFRPLLLASKEGV